MIARILVVFLTLAAALPAAAGPGANDAHELRVGAGELFRKPSEAAAAAREGDTVTIAAGTYRDCAVWRTPAVMVRASPGEVVEIEGPVCGEKGLFVIAAPGMVVEGITFRGARAFGGNGAGIRAEGGDLTVRNSTFVDNENGILTHAQLPDAKLLIEDSVFLGNGALRDGRECAHGLYVGHFALVSIRRTRFAGSRVCHHVKSRAARTEIVDSLIEDGPSGDSSYLVDIPNGGDLLLRGSTLRKGPQTNNRRTAVMIGAEGIRHPTDRLEIHDNHFENLMPWPTVFVENRSRTPAQVWQNDLSGSVIPLLGPGGVR